MEKRVRVQWLDDHKRNVDGSVFVRSRLVDRAHGRESHQSIGAVEHMSHEVSGLPRTLKTAHDARIGGKVTLDHDFISCLIRHSAGLVARFRVRASGHTSYELVRQSASREERSWSSEISSGHSSPPRRSSASWSTAEVRSCGLERQKAATSTLVWTIVERGGSEPCVASQKAAGGGAK